jgi:hypothetical protein
MGWTMFIVYIPCVIRISNVKEALNDAIEVGNVVTSVSHVKACSFSTAIMICKC